MKIFIAVLPKKCLFCRVLQALQQEEIMNVFLDDYKALGTLAEDGDWCGKVSEGLMLNQAFSDQKYTKDKKITSINWHPTIYGKEQNHSQGRNLSTRFQQRKFAHSETLTKGISNIKSLNTLMLSSTSIIFCQFRKRRIILIRLLYLVHQSKLYQY